jgi:ElaB/YqjD/DUF883 family membrane-anchored ribosome-binding protein
METVTREKLVDDMKDVLRDVEQLMKQAAAASGQQATELRDRASSALASARSKLDGLQADVTRAGKQAARATDDWVHDNPWSSIALAGSVGILIGVLVARR